MASPPADKEILKLGRAHTSCKECLPMILSTGHLIKHASERDSRKDGILVFFMPTAMGPCRFGQYHIYLKSLIERMELPNIAVLSLTSEDGYGGLGPLMELRIWWAILISDVMDDIRNTIMAIARDREGGMRLFSREWQRILEALKGDWKLLKNTLHSVASNLRQVELRTPVKDAKKISLVGEIFVRSDNISRQYIVDRLAKQGYIVKVSPIAEWVYYSRYLVREGMTTDTVTFGDQLALTIKEMIMVGFEKRIKKIMAASGLYEYELVDVRNIIDKTSHIVSPKLTGEVILTVGVSLNETVNRTSGSIAIGPFCCMPNRISEALLSETMSREYKSQISKNGRYMKNVLEQVPHLPFLAIESDGGPFPQIIEAKLETFCLQVDRLHKVMMECRSTGN
jgi:predicted nucleotide-binding protein (sugar kinase/HSP70/actin superfamily)